MERITVQQACSLIAEQDEIHSMLTNPAIEHVFFIAGWHKEHGNAVESIETADELYLLTEQEAFCSHRLLCIKPKGKYPDERIYMELKPGSENDLPSQEFDR